MALKPKFYGEIKKGRFTFTDPQQKNRYELYSSRYPNDTEMEITISKKFKRRSQGAPGEFTNFNGYLWHVVLRMIGDEIGELDLDQVHAWTQIAVGNCNIMKDGTKVPKGTSEMSGGEFSDYCQRVRVWAAQELNLTIPEPNEVLEDY